MATTLHPRFGKTQDSEQRFLAAVRATLAQGDAYVVLDPDCPAAFQEACRALCPVLLEPRAKGCALVLEGVPSEWTPDDLVDPDQAA